MIHDFLWALEMLKGSECMVHEGEFPISKNKMLPRIGLFDKNLGTKIKLL